MSSVEETTSQEALDTPKDSVREALLAEFTQALGSEHILDSHIRVDDDLWIRVTRESWVNVGNVAKKLGFTYFDFLSGIDWKPSPFGRDMDSQEDISVSDPVIKELPPMVSGYAGGETRFQIFARVVSPTRHIGVTFKVDIDDNELSLDTWSQVYRGANWHEREACEMFGITFIGHPNLIHMYLPGNFEGYPLRKDFPLLSRRMKPWPGIVDVEPMPGQDEDSSTEEGGQ